MIFYIVVRPASYTLANNQTCGQCPVLISNKNDFYLVGLNVGS